MTTERRDVTYCVLGTTSFTLPLEVAVDNHGEGWLTPDQVDRLERARAAAEAARPDYVVYELPRPTPPIVVASAFDTEFRRASRTSAVA